MFLGEELCSNPDWLRISVDYIVDALEWPEQASKGRPYDMATPQVMLSLAAIHTMSDMLTQVLYDLCTRHDLIQALRQEVISVLKEDGWRKSSLSNLRLMDSVLKESQRMKPAALGP